MDTIGVLRALDYYVHTKCHEITRFAAAVSPLLVFCFLSKTWRLYRFRCVEIAWIRILMHTMHCRSVKILSTNRRIKIISSKFRLGVRWTLCLYILHRLPFYFAIQKACWYEKFHSWFSHDVLIWTVVKDAPANENPRKWVRIFGLGFGVVDVVMFIR